MSRRYRFLQPSFFFHPVVYGKTVPDFNADMLDRGRRHLKKAKPTFFIQKKFI